jgi:Protein of unknown function (DUF2817)
MSTPFALTYQNARRDFLSAAQAQQATLHQDLHPLPGVDGEELALDIAVIGTASAPRRLLLSSACHGVEGYCGSGIQVAALRDHGLIEAARAAGICLIFAHALNPYGFSHWRRNTNENVDLNRNFLDFSQPLPANPAYAELHELMFPEQWPPSPANQAAVAQAFASKGMAFMQQAVSGGQHSHPQGFYFGGTSATWSNGAVRRLLRNHCASAHHLGWIDFHTGLGPSGHGERIFTPVITATQTLGLEALYARSSAWWGGDGKTTLTRIEDGSTSSAPLTGTIKTAGVDECPNTDITKITLEYGTLDKLDMLRAMRAEQWLYMHPEAPAEMAAPIKQGMFDAFFTNTPQWQAQVLEQGLEAIQQAIAGLNV